MDITAHSSPHIRHAKYHSLDELREALQAWEVEYVQTEPGALNVDSLIVQAPGFHFAHNSFGRKNHRKALSPEGCRTFFIPSGPQLPYTAFCQPVLHDQILAIPRSREYEAVASGGTNVFSLSIAEEELQRLAQVIDAPDMPETIAGGTTFTPVPAALTELRTVLWSMSRRGRAQELEQCFAPVCAAAKTALASCLAGSVECGEFSPPRRRDMALKAALEFMEENAGEMITVADLCQAARVSARTLLYAFRERFDTTPKAYLQAYRLRMVQRELLFRGAQRVTDAATKWGFWHMGQFAADYKRQFGELPSHTRKRASATG